MTCKTQQAMQQRQKESFLRRKKEALEIIEILFLVNEKVK